MATALSTSDRKKLRAHEQTIEAGLRSFVEVGNALRLIRDDQLYLEVAETFEQYCRIRFKFSDRRARQLIDGSKAVAAVESTGTIVPVNEAQARILSELPDESTQATVWTKAVETAPTDGDGNPKVTAAHVAKVAAALQKPKKCRNCGGTEFDSDGDCTACYEPPEPRAKPEQVRPFAHLPSLPADMSDAFEAMKLCCLRHRLAGWSEITKGDFIETLKALIELAKAEGK